MKSFVNVEAEIQHYCSWSTEKTLKIMIASRQLQSFNFGCLTFQTARYSATSDALAQKTKRILVANFDILGNVILTSKFTKMNLDYVI